MRGVLRASVVAAAASLATPAAACIIATEMAPRDFAGTDVVLVAMLGEHGTRLDAERATVEVRTIETLHGEHRDAWVLDWFDFPFSTPALNHPDPVIVGIILPGEERRFAMPGGELLGPTLSQVPCAQTAYLEDTPEARAEIARLWAETHR